jgi:hypothetical protein
MQSHTSRENRQDLIAEAECSRRSSTSDRMKASTPSKSKKLLKSNAPPSLVSRFLDSESAQIIGAVLAVKVLILIYGALSWQIIENKPSPGWLNLWSRWDAVHYQTLAVHGYQAIGDERFLLVYFPLYPWLIRVFGFVFGGPLIGAFVVSTVASIAAARLLDRLAALDEPGTSRRWPVWFLLIFPTSYFLHIGYTESLFLALVLGSFVAARRDRWALAGSLGLLVGLTRFNGLVLIPTLGIEAWQSYRFRRSWNWNWLWIGLIPFGFLIYLFLNYYFSGSAWTFVAFQKEHWFRSFAWPWVGVQESWRTFVGRTPEDAQIIGGQELFFAFLGLLCTVWCCVKLRLAYSIWMVGNLLLICSTPFLLSVPRYMLVMFPIYFLFARAAQKFLWRLVLTAWSLLFLGLFTANFVRGHWTF